MPTRTLILTCFMVTALAVGVASSASAAPTNLLDAHGTFEKPAVLNPGKTFKPGSPFDGWEVRRAPVTLGRAFSPVVVPPQGHQILELVDAFKAGSHVPGAVCRPMATKAGHQYRISFLGAVITTGTARLVVKLGSNTASVSPSPAKIPAEFKPFHVTLRSPKPHAVICFTASNVTKDAYPAIDAARVVDLGT